MIRSQLDLLEIQDQEAVKNTYYRYPKVHPHLSMDENQSFLEVKTIDNVARIYKIGEVILYIIARFRWAPAWLIHQWFEVYDLDGYAEIENWINVGLVWAQTGSTGVFIRPTYCLFKIMDIKQDGYIDIPFNLLNHTCSEMQIVFDVMMGNEKSEIWYFMQNLKGLPMYHPLNIKVENDSGFPIFVEAEYRSPLKPELLRDKQDELIRSIRTKNPLTAEFTDMSLFTLVTEDNIKNKSGLYTQRPDLVVPAMRDQLGNPNSIAIEMELSPKIDSRYDKIMQSYKNNLIYGNLIYLCGNNNIIEKVKNAYKEAGGLGSCKLFVANCAAPAQRITDYSSREENAYRRLLDSTKKFTGEQDIGS